MGDRLGDIEGYRRVNIRPCSVLTIGGFRPTRDPLATHFGLAPVAAPGEVWPSVEGRPLFFICQLNLTEAPFVPALLQDLSLITFFLDWEAREYGRENGEGWLLRTYRRLEDLNPLAIPVGATFTRGFEARWHQADDQPVFDDPDLVDPDDFRQCGVHLKNIHRTKVGGYASNIQSGQWWGPYREEPYPGYRPHPSIPRYCFQIASEEKVGLFWGDNGIMYLARGTAPGHEQRWFFDSQCY